MIIVPSLFGQVADLEKFPPRLAMTHQWEVLDKNESGLPSLVHCLEKWKRSWRRRE